ncbi:MAG: 4-(cytidine 5'-diphospho)-2-C-methyl-D-erythritol kinase [Planctomycetales bacterium]|nr:4-(cytidine 5'-diphospho)-2-C-methyl-D-erythritol kinase [Planctomycetales bacterium]
MLVRIAADRVEIQAPAKINLFLEILAKRPDGYHEIETLMSPIGLYDSLTFPPTESPEIRLDCRWATGLVRNQPDAPAKESAADVQPQPSVNREAKLSCAGASGWCEQSPEECTLGDLPPAEKNIVHKAASLLQERSGCGRGAAIRLIKRIPSSAGLGGASSDAAAVLVAGNIAWKIDWPRERLMEMAAELGSDIPFFLRSGSAICRGRGERIENAGPIHLHVVVVRPPVGLSTPQVYQHCRPASTPVCVQKLQSGLRSGNWKEIKSALVNRLEEPAAQLTPWIGRLRKEFENAGCIAQQMSGSGSSYFGICENARHARSVAGRLRSKRLGMVTATTTTG